MIKPSSANMPSHLQPDSDFDLLFKTEAKDLDEVFTYAAMNRRAKLLIAGRRNCQICLWQMSSFKNDPLLVQKGSQSSVECISFMGEDDALVAAGSASGSVKIWDIAKNIIVSTFTGHKANVKCLAFNPVDKTYFASGSMDTTAKVWDIRQPKKCANTLKSHSKQICSLDFSPDGRWLVTSGEDCRTKIWDLSAGGKLMVDLAGHSGAVTACKFHPNEYLLATGSADKTVRFWDLETFECVGQSETDSQPIQQILYHPSGKALYSVSKSTLRLLGWEPTRIFDSRPLAAAGDDDVSSVMSAGFTDDDDNLLFVALNHDCRQLSVRAIGQRKLKPFSDPSPLANAERQESPQTFVRSSSKLRRSFYEHQLAPAGVPVVSQQNKNDFTPSDDDEVDEATFSINVSSTSTSSDGLTKPAEFPNLPRASKQEMHFNLEHTTPFKPRHSLKRSPVRTAALDTNSLLNNSGADKVESPPVENVEICVAKMSVEDSRAKETLLQCASSVPAAKKTSLPKAKATVKPLRPHRDSSGSRASPQPLQQHLDTRLVQNLNPDDFLQCQEVSPFSSLSLPSNVHLLQSSSSSCLPSAVSGGANFHVISEDDCLNSVHKQSDSLLAIFQSRAKSCTALGSIWKVRGVRGALESVISTNNTAALVDLLHLINGKSNLWTLDVCCLSLPRLPELLQSKYATYSQIASESLRIILRDFGKVIKNGLKSVPSIGVDISQEERCTKCQKCYVALLSLRSEMSTTNWNLHPHSHREISLLMQQVLDGS